MDTAIKEYNAFVIAISEMLGRFPLYRKSFEKSVLVVDFGLLSKEEHDKLVPVRETYYLWSEDTVSKWTSNLIADVGDEKHYVIDQVDTRVDDEGLTLGFNYLVAVYVK